MNSFDNELWSLHHQIDTGLRLRFRQMTQIKAADGKQGRSRGWRQHTTWGVILLTTLILLLLKQNFTSTPSGRNSEAREETFSTSNSEERSKLLLEARQALLKEFANVERRPIFVPETCADMENDTQKMKTAFNKVYDETKWGGKKLKPEDFYNNAKWPPAERKSGSGGGSDLGNSTETSLRILNDVIQKHNITSMIDVPCGDTNWIFDSIWTDHHLSLYLGLDVASHPVQQNALRFSHHLNKEFRQWDATTCSLPKFKFSAAEEPRPFELIHVRDVLQHLPLQFAINFVCHIFTSGARVLVTTTFPNGRNQRTKPGGFYYNDLFKSPYDFPETSGVCETTHPTLETDLTCIFDLRQDWVKQFVDSKCDVSGV